VTYRDLLPENLVYGRSVAYETSLWGPLAARVGGLALCEVDKGHVFFQSWSSGGSGRKEYNGGGEAGKVHSDGSGVCKVKVISVCEAVLYLW
jgi:hypothetical protein